MDGQRPEETVKDSSRGRETLGRMFDVSSGERTRSEESVTLAGSLSYSTLFSIAWGEAALMEL